MEPVFTTHDTARILGLHPFTVARHIDGGQLRGFRTAGGHRRVAAAELRRYLVEQGMEIPTELLGTDGRIRLLVVDDEQPVLDAVRQAFKPFASEVELTVTTSAIEAMLLIGTTRPDALLIDVKVAELDGLEICRRVSSSKSLAGVKLVTMASAHRSDIIGSSLTAGALGCLAKPINPKELLALLAPARRERRR